MKKKILAAFLILFIGSMIFGIVQVAQNPEEYQNIPEEIPVVFDALQYQVVDGKNITEAELIEKLGEPDSIEEWKHEIGGGLFYPIRTLYYQDAEYSFNDDKLQRVTVYGSFTYESKEDFLPMFNLKRYENTTINDTNCYYRAYDCGVHDLWLEYGDGKITMVKISYGSIFG